MKVLKGIICLILSGEWLGDDAYPVERAADPLHRPGIDSKPFGDDPYTRPSRSRQGLTDSFSSAEGYRIDPIATLFQSFSGIRVVRSDRINRQISDPRISSIRPIFVAALVAAMLPTCTQSCDALSSGEQFSIAADLFTHPVSIYWRDRLFSKTHSPSSLLAHR
jgi:hypothetical protein